MTVIEAAIACGFEIICGGNNPHRIIESVYCCDLLSLVMGRAPTGCGWVTVMGNQNAVAVAVLADISCIILAEGMGLDSQAKEKALQQGICVFSTPMPVFEAASLLNSHIKHND